MIDGPATSTSGRSRPRRSRTSSPQPSAVVVVGPVRTCVGCRQRGARADLVRLVRVDDHRVVVDEPRCAPGRGGWLHPRRECLELALRRGGLTRALRLQQPVDVVAVQEWFDEVCPRASGPSGQV